MSVLCWDEYMDLECRKLLVNTVRKHEAVLYQINLFINHYKKIVFKMIDYNPQLVVLDQQDSLEIEIHSDFYALRKML